jgi:Fic family protein
MKNHPPYQLTSKILELVNSIAFQIGQLEGLQLRKPSVHLRKQNRVKTIRNSLSIEGNTLSEEQITAILEGKRVIGPSKDILEVKNAIFTYDKLDSFNPLSLKSFLKAHQFLMKDLVKSAGQFRSTNVGILKGSRVAHVAPKPIFLSQNMALLFDYLKTPNEKNWLIKSCVAHYEIEFIHPFEDGNGRMGRLWQTLLLKKYHPFFEYVVIESVIKQKQRQYYEALEQSDKQGESTIFVEFALAVIDKALSQFILDFKPEPQTPQVRLGMAKQYFQKSQFSRKEYLQHFKTISTATASRDLLLGTTSKILKKVGRKATTLYQFHAL